MPERILSQFQNWVDSNHKGENYSIVDLLENFGYTNVLWIMLSPNRENYLIEHSTTINREFLSSFNQSDNFDKIKNWMTERLHNQILKIGDTSRTVLYLNRDEYSNISAIFADLKDDDQDISRVRIITKIAVKMIEKGQKIHTLENALRLGYLGSEMNSPVEVSKITINNLSPGFVKDVVPHTFYSIVHEDFGPNIFEAVPDEMNKPDYIITAVKLFSGLDSEMVASVGHVFKTDPIKDPVMGEIFSIVFTLPNDDARGKFEIHSVSVLIPQEFMNLSKSLIGEFKTQLFMAIEKLRYTHEEKDWGIAVDEFGSSDHLKSEIYKILEDLRMQLALSYALIMQSDDVLNW